MNIQINEPKYKLNQILKSNDNTCELKILKREIIGDIDKNEFYYVYHCGIREIGNNNFIKMPITTSEYALGLTYKI